MPLSESKIQEQVATFLRIHYPDVIFHSDFGSGIKLTPGQAMKQKRLNGGQKAYPDMFIAEPIYEFDEKNKITGCKYKGLFLELKRDGVRIHKINGEWANDHIAEQAKVLARLNKKGYVARFAVGYDMAIDIIEKYLSGAELWEI